MTSGLTDRQLLECVRSRRDERAALEELVRRHLAFVYATARRHVRDPHLAEDVTQAVFIVLMRKAGSIRDDTVLPAWLYTVTRNAVSVARRGEQRRAIHETRRFFMRDHPADDQRFESESDATELQPLLDDAIATLGERDRCGVLLYYFGQRTHKQVGDAMGISEEAARKRVTRAVDKMRTILKSRGAPITGVGAIASALSAEAVACAAAVPPAALSASTVNVALLANTVTPTTTAGAIAKGISTLTTLAKLKVAASIVVATIAITGAALPIIAIASNQAKDPVASTPTPSTPTTASSTQPSDGSVINVTDKVRVTFVGVSSYPPDNDTWFAIDGKPIEPPIEQLPQVQQQQQSPEPKHVLVFRINDVDARATMTVRGSVSNMVTLEGDDQGSIYYSSFLLANDSPTLHVEIGLATEPWKTQAEHTKLKEGGGVDSAIGHIEIDAAEEIDGKTQFVLHFPSIQEPRRLIAIDVDGKTVTPSNNSENGDGQNSVLTSAFEMPVEKLSKLQLQTLAFLKHVDVKDISLERDQITVPKIEVKDEK